MESKPHPLAHQMLNSVPEGMNMNNLLTPMLIRHREDCFDQDENRTSPIYTGSLDPARSLKMKIDSNFMTSHKRGSLPTLSGDMPKIKIGSTKTHLRNLFGVSTHLLHSPPALARQEPEPPQTPSCLPERFNNREENKT